ncbi:hypothetical protein [Szabonella alba]|uniref:Chitin-binding type-2 domain-containing protein n=1 Tax=Szabonella alba TaxID=2804194 RepID=A0A8K0V8K2_9RHOB|nr:hypothetical protein [Szabonella alba]MBL4917679.1 hypothetical protein [Szabonella alba]
MKTKAAIALIALMLSPGMAAAYCAGSKHSAMSCGDGTTYDAETRACVPVTG